MAKVKVYELIDNSTRKEIYSYDSKLSLEKPFDIVREIEFLQNEYDFLNVGKIKSIGISSINVGDKLIDSYIIDGICKELVTGRNSSLLGRDVGTSENKNNPVMLENGEYTELYLSFTAYESGVVLQTGIVGQSLFGNYDAYLKKITSKNFVSTILKDAKLFNSYKALLDYIKKHESAFRHCVKNGGYKYSIQNVNGGPTKKKNDLAVIDELNSLIDSINDTAIEETEKPLPSEINEEIMKIEAIDRLDGFKCVDYVKNNFLKGKLMQSEIGGMLYELDEDAKKAVEGIKEKGYLPYHVIATPLLGTIVYSVLAVSNDLEEWPYERVNTLGQLACWVYMPQYEGYEYGTVTVRPTNGGIARVG